MQPVLHYKNVRRDAHPEERPIEWIPGAHLRIGEKRVPGPGVGSPKRNAPGVEFLRKIVLHDLIVIGGIPQDGCAIGRHRRPVTDQRHCQENERAEDRPTVTDRAGNRL
jgi:hypothetical protein